MISLDRVSGTSEWLTTTTATMTRSFSLSFRFLTLTNETSFLTEQTLIINNIPNECIYKYTIYLYTYYSAINTIKNITSSEHDAE